METEEAIRKCINTIQVLKEKCHLHEIELEKVEGSILECHEIIKRYL